jgi:ADP-ribose pyrophosphatase YjhB (NUDIX family)
VPAPPPHLMASAVVLDAGGRHTLLVRVDEYGRWGLVGGHVVGGEPLAEAARRELRDKAGVLRFRVMEPHLAVQQDLIDCGHGEARHVDHVFAVVVDISEPAEPLPADELADAQLGWFTASQLPEPLVPGVRMHVRSAQRTAFGD